MTILAVALSLALIVFFIKASTWRGHVFEWLDRYLSRFLPEKIYKPLIGCSLCMTFWHSWYIYLIAHFIGIEGFENIRFTRILFTIFIACGWAAVLLVFSKIQEDLKPIKTIEDENSRRRNRGGSRVPVR